MIQAAKIIKTGLGTTRLIGAGVGIGVGCVASVIKGNICYFHHTSVQNTVDPNNGLELDSTGEIATKYYRDKEGLKNYFEAKKTTIEDSFKADYNSAVASGVSASELEKWLDRKNDLLSQLSDQKEDALDLASIPVSPQDSSEVVQTEYNSFEPFDE